MRTYDPVLVGDPLEGWKACMREPHVGMPAGDYVRREDAEAAIEAALAEVPTAVAAYIEELQFLADNWSESDDLARAVRAMTPAQRKACGIPEEP